ncbi:MAG: hypothetical protein WC708_20005 [Lentisphaeria bacterium]
MLLVPAGTQAKTCHREFARGLARFRQTTPKAMAGYVVYAGDLTSEVAADRFLNFQDAGTITGRR